MTDFKKAGETIFNGTILVFTISFGLFPFVIEKATVTTMTLALFIVTLILIIVCGVLSLIFSYVGITSRTENDAKKWIKPALIMVLIMIGLIALIQISIFTSIVQKIVSV